MSRKNHLNFQRAGFEKFSRHRSEKRPGIAPPVANAFHKTGSSQDRTVLVFHRFSPHPKPQSQRIHLFPGAEQKFFAFNLLLFWTFPADVQLKKCQ